jgi:hypothetical protein
MHDGRADTAPDRSWINVNSNNHPADRFAKSNDVWIVFDDKEVATVDWREIVSGRRFASQASMTSDV